jgi:hypothetical protein
MRTFEQILLYFVSYQPEVTDSNYERVALEKLVPFEEFAEVLVPFGDF